MRLGSILSSGEAYNYIEVKRHYSIFDAGGRCGKSWSGLFGRSVGLAASDRTFAWRLGNTVALSPVLSIGTLSSSRVDGKGRAMSLPRGAWHPPCGAGCQIPRVGVYKCVEVCVKNIVEQAAEAAVVQKVG